MKEKFPDPFPEIKTVFDINSKYKIIYQRKSVCIVLLLFIKEIEQILSNKHLKLNANG